MGIFFPTRDKDSGILCFFPHRLDFKEFAGIGFPDTEPTYFPAGFGLHLSFSYYHGKKW